MLAEELKALGLIDARLDEHGYVYATLPATPGYEAAPGLGFIAHMDTAPGTSGENVQPQLHENYDGGDVTPARDRRRHAGQGLPVFGRHEGPDPDHGRRHDAAWRRR